MMLSLRSKLFRQLENAKDDELESLKQDFETIAKDWTSLEKEFKTSSRISPTQSRPILTSEFDVLHQMR